MSVAPLDGARLVEALPEAEAYMDWAGGLVWLALPAAPDGNAARVRQAKGPTGHATLVRAGEQWTPMRAGVFDALAGFAQPASAYDVTEVISRRENRRVAANSV